ncbi:uncharacterized protein LOC105793124 [Gossypium raimondii]|uniref:uncharacterized protein LOC105793124 n=1 Tax=Gossypium raimondii TaxID=29730 RepID=UPI00063B00B7|nr:uncharacterized protein LOC105793124 [Gossypium raimondii]
MEVVKTEILKWLEADVIYPIADSKWVSPIHVVPKKGGITIVTNEEGLEIPTRVQNGWRVPIAPEDQEKTTFTCPFGTYAFKRMPFELYNAPANFQRVLRRCIETNLILNFEKCHLMVEKCVVLGHVVSAKGLEVDQAKVEEFDLEIKDKKGKENLVADHLSRIETGILRDEPKAFPTRADDARTMVKLLKTNILNRYRVPRAIISDKGTHFCNRTLKALFAQFGVTHKVSTAYHPQTNGQAESSNKEIKEIWRKL